MNSSAASSPSETPQLPSFRRQPVREVDYVTTPPSGVLSLAESRTRAWQQDSAMYSSSHSGLSAEPGRFHRGQTAFAAGRTGGSTSLAGQYPSPYQARHRLNSKSGSRGYKRRANTSAGGDGLSGALGGGGSGVGLTLSSASSHPCARQERDRFLVDINNGAPRGGGAAPNQLLNAARDSSSEGSTATGGSMWLPNSAHRNSRLAGNGRQGVPSSSRGGGSAAAFGDRMSPLGSSYGGGRSGEVPAGSGSGVADRFTGGGRISVPHRYSRPRDRIDSGMSSTTGGAGRRVGRHRGLSAGIGEPSPAPGAGRLPAIESGAAGVKEARANYQKTHQLGGGAGKERVVREAGTTMSGVCTIQGFKPGNPRWENQDNYVMEEDLQGLSTRLFVVLDGHGEMGHLVSRRCVERLPKLVVDAGLSTARAVLKMSEDLRGCAVDCSSSGATCVLVTISGDKICVANLGDSKCVLARLANGQLRAVPLSEDHKPDRPDERQRILDLGGQVGSRHLVVGSSPSGPIRIPMGPARVWYRCRGEIMGLAMSRSLGDDIAHQAGVSSEPEVLEHQIDVSDQFLILATDGVWDVTEIGQAVQIVQGYASRSRGSSWDPQGAATLLAHTARKRWEGLSAVVDDITAMVIRLNLS